MTKTSLKNINEGNNINTNAKIENKTKTKIDQSLWLSLIIICSLEKENCSKTDSNNYTSSCIELN